MARKPSLKPRKPASQTRSRLTVDSLVEATARILVKEGYERASTNRIAQAAGVSVGSLYQYFPGKEALVAAVVDRHMREVMDLMRESLAKVAMQPMDAAVRELVAAMLDAHRIDPKLHRVLAEQVPRMGGTGNVEAIDREVHALVRGYLEARKDELRVPDPDIAAFICVSTVEALTHAAVIRNPAFLEDRADTLIDEATRLVVRYLRRDAGAPTSA
jgi:AcrR family transcriptional regulator